MHDDTIEIILDILNDWIENAKLYGINDLELQALKNQKKEYLRERWHQLS